MARIQTEYIIELCEYGIVWTLCMLIFIYTLLHIRRNISFQSSKRRITASVITFSVLGMCAFITNISLQIAFILLDTYAFSDAAELCTALSMLTLFFGESMGHLLFLDRLRSVFKATEYALSNCAIVSFCVLIGVFLVNWSAYSAVHISFHHDLISWDDTEIMYLALLWLGAAIDLFVVGTLSYWFVHRLFQVSVAVNDEWNGRRTQQVYVVILLHESLAWLVGITKKRVSSDWFFCAICRYDDPCLFGIPIDHSKDAARATKSKIHGGGSECEYVYSGVHKGWHTTFNARSTSRS